MPKIFIPLLLSVISIIISVDLEKLRSSILADHNLRRKNHKVDPLEIDHEIEKIAQNYSETLAEAQSTDYSGNEYNGEKLGENIYRGTNLTINGDEVSSLWYSEINNYNFSSPGFSSSAGHFTQIVWKATTKIGCGASCNNGTFCVVVCNYYPKGNTNDEDFAQNVFEAEKANNEESGSNVLMVVIIVILAIVILGIVGFLVLHFANKKKKDEVQEYMNH